jgi:hypothetical protein
VLSRAEAGDLKAKAALESIDREEMSVGRQSNPRSFSESQNPTLRQRLTG